MKRVSEVTIVVKSTYSGATDAHKQTVVRFVVDDPDVPGLTKEVNLTEMDVTITASQLASLLSTYLAEVKTACEDQEGI